jgi:SET domain-containing protein
VIEYVGERISKRQSLQRCSRNNQAIFYLDGGWDLDGSIESNAARFLNHSCSPNCDAERIDRRIWIVARCEILAGEEITFNYGYDLENYREHPCRCGARKCVGFIVAEEFFGMLRARVGAASR